MINQLVQVTAGHEMVSCMDAYLGYNQIKMYTPDQEKLLSLQAKDYIGIQLCHLGSRMQELRIPRIRLS